MIVVSKIKFCIDSKKLSLTSIVPTCTALYGFQLQIIIINWGYK